MGGAMLDVLGGLVGLASIGLGTCGQLAADPRAAEPHCLAAN